MGSGTNLRGAIEVDRGSRRSACETRTQESSSRWCSTNALRIDSSPSFRRDSIITSETLTVDRPACLIKYPDQYRNCRNQETKSSCIKLFRGAGKTHFANDSISMLAVSMGP